MEPKSLTVDLRPLQSTSRRARQNAGILIGGLGFITAGIVVVAANMDPNLPGAQRVAELCGAAALVAFTLFILVGLLWPSPSSIELGSNEVKLVFPKGQARMLSWDEIVAQAELRQVKVVKGGTGAKPYAGVYLSRPIPHTFAISPGGLDSLRQAASGAGLREVVRDWQAARRRDRSTTGQKLRFIR